LAVLLDPDPPVRSLGPRLSRQAKQRLQATGPHRVVVVELDDPAPAGLGHGRIAGTGGPCKPEAARVVGPRLARTELEVADPGIADLRHLALDLGAGAIADHNDLQLAIALPEDRGE